MEIKFDIKSNKTMAYDALSKLVGHVIDCQDEGMILKVEFFGSKATPPPQLYTGKFDPLERIGPMKIGDQNS